jgi:hypothetical protein
MTNSKQVLVPGVVALAVSCAMLGACGDGKISPIEGGCAALNEGATCPCDGSSTTCDDGSKCCLPGEDGGICVPQTGSVCDAYCVMEATCIPKCYPCPTDNGLGTCSCSLPEVVKDCAQSCPDWANRYLDEDAACKASFSAWMDCITQVSCGDVETFFEKHPDGLVDGDPCAAEYFATAHDCTDFEPRTEYSFDNDTDTGTN